MLTDVMLRAVWFGPACVSIYIMSSKAAYDADKVFLAAFDKLEAMMPKGNFYAPDDAFEVYKARKLESYVGSWAMHLQADVLSGTYSSGVHRAGVLEEWAYLSSSFHYLSIFSPRAHFKHTGLS
ncbi:hypothetical protein POTOM_041070 [Populus tomentosa]|uniref:Uncharacterized protein n=1 Tax=Populus tomentosa TaxID=118781 RepID=A0A8X7YTX9_POPTO|nr:hypothetical protein POTOM_041070 [Populus tomentosa]